MDSYNAAILLVTGGFFLLAFAAASYVFLRFLALILSLDAAILREFKLKPQVSNISNTTGKSQEGDFVPYSDEAAWAAEFTKRAGQSDLSEAEIQDFLNRAVGAATDKS